MDFSDAYERLKRKNKILFSKDSPCLQELACQLSVSGRKAAVLWALECSQKAAEKIEKAYPEDLRPMEAVEKSRLWSQGVIKMPQARKYILAVHAMAREIYNPSHKALCHGVGQGCSTVHTVKHALGLPIYELTSIALEYGFDEGGFLIEEKIYEYLQCLYECRQMSQNSCLLWADFIK